MFGRMVNPFGAMGETMDFADGIDQDQTAQNVQSDLGSMHSAC